jgi:hypothetical protein
VEIGAEAPVLRQEVVIQTPAPATLHAALVEARGVSPVRWEASDQIESDRSRGLTTRILRFASLPAHPDEGGLPTRERIPQLVFSTCESWDTLLAWLRQGLLTASAPDSSIAAWAKGDLTSGRPPLDDVERMERIASLIGERTTKADDPAFDWFLPIRPAPRTFGASCGNLLDRAALALAAVNASGLSGDFALLPAVSSVAREVPCLAQFDDVWLHAGPLTLDIGGGTYSARPEPGLAEETLVRSNSGGATWVPLPPRRSKSSLSLHLRLDEKGAVKGEAIVRVGGPLRRTIDTSDIDGFLGDLAGQYVQGAAVAGSKIVALTPDTLALTFSLTGTNLGDSLGGGRRRFAFPSAPGLPDGTTPTDLALTRRTRETAILLPCLVDGEVRARLDLGSGTRPLILPRAGKEGGKAASIETLVERDGETILLERRFATSERTIRQEEYPAFRAVLLRLTDPDANALYLDGSGEAP